ncbi:MAG: phosphoesterase [Planctomycetota bacterium]|nr:phosphoesterase [Planctomycetota bacterium]MDA1214896.1 phosphoesterase [Planctomycetota bacterium]
MKGPLRMNAKAESTQDAVTSDTQKKPVEHVLVVPTLLFHEIGHFQGFSPKTEQYLDILLDPAVTSYRPRNEMEDDPSFKQLIPYCIFRHQGEIFYYRRGKAGDEGRLHSKRSIGIGGHISTLDQNGADSVYRVGMQREIAEEVDISTGFKETCIGLINDDLTEVGKVHLGVVHIFDLDTPKVQPRETSILETGFASPAQLAQDLESFETWSQICLNHLLSD